MEEFSAHSKYKEHKYRDQSQAESRLYIHVTGEKEKRTSVDQCGPAWNGFRSDVFHFPCEDKGKANDTYVE